MDAKKKRAEVRCGNMRLTVKAEELYRIYEKKPIKDKKQNVQVVRKVSAPAAVRLEINLLGKTVMEAVAEVDALYRPCRIDGIGRSQDHTRRRYGQTQRGDPQSSSRS